MSNVNDGDVRRHWWKRCWQWLWSSGSTAHNQQVEVPAWHKASMWALSAAVAVIAAIVSYSHIYALGREHGGSGVSAKLLPLSVDLLILVGELMLLHQAGRRFVLGWVLVCSGILATMAANVTYGAQFGVAGAIIWGWPAYSFILVAGGMVAIVKRVTAGHRRTVARVSRTAGKQAREPSHEVAPVASRGLSEDEAQVQIPAVRRPRGAAPKQIEMTAELAADLEAGLSARELDRKYQELSRWTAGNLVRRHRELTERSESREEGHFTGQPVADDDDDELIGDADGQ